MTILAACAIAFGVLVAPALAQQPAPAPMRRHVGGARSTVPTGPGRVDESAGVLVSDGEAGQIRLDAAGRAVFVIPHDRVTALHYERSEYPRRFLRRSSHYLTIHYTNAAGASTFESIRLLSERDALAAIDVLERHTGRGAERSPTAQSFLGIPNRARAGARIAVTDHRGETMTGTLAELSMSSLTLADMDGVRRLFEAHELRRIRLLYSPKHDALVGLAWGAGYTTLGTFLAAGLSGCFDNPASDCRVGRAMAGAAAVGGGIGALIGTTIGAIRYPFNKAFDVYRPEAEARLAVPTVTVAPAFEPSRSALSVIVRF